MASLDSCRQRRGNGIVVIAVVPDLEYLNYLT